MATIVPSATMVRRMLPGVVLEAIVIAVCAFGYMATENLLWFAPIGVAAVIFLVWFVGILRSHPTEWRFGGQR